MDSKNYFVACHEVLGVATNCEQFKWSYGATMPRATRREFEGCAVRLRVEIERDVPLPPLARLGKYHYWYGAPGEDTLYYDRPFFFGRRLRLAIKGILGDEPVVTVSQSYFRFISHRFMNLHSVGYILTDLASLLLLRRGLAPLHCSAFRWGDATVVVAAAPNTGKTLTSMMTCLHHAADYVAEDLAVTDGRDIYSVPWTSTFRYYREIDRSFAARLRSSATRLFPPIELLTASRPTPISEFVPSDRIVARSRVTHVVVLDRGNTQLNSLDADDAYRRLRNLNRYEFNYHKAPFAVAHEYFNPDLNIDAACRAEEALIRRLVENAGHRWLVRSDDPTRYASMIIHAICNRVRGATSMLAAA